MGTGWLRGRVYTVLIDICMYVPVSVHMCACEYVCKYTCVSVYLYMCVYMHACVHVCACICLFVSIRNNITLKIHPSSTSNSPIVNLIPYSLNFGITESIQTENHVKCDFIPLWIPLNLTAVAPKAGCARAWRYDFTALGGLEGGNDLAPHFITKEA